MKRDLKKGLKLSKKVERGKVIGQYVAPNGWIIAHGHLQKTLGRIPNPYVTGLEGFFILESSIDKEPEKILEAYKKCDLAEKFIRDLKEGAEIRPIRHWSKNVVIGFVLIVFLTKFLISLTQFLCKNSIVKNLKVLSDARELCNKAVELAEQGKYDEAIQLMDSVIKIDGNNATAWHNKGIIQYKQGRYLDAVNSFGQAADIDPGYIEAWYNKGIALAGLGKYLEAIRAFDKVLSVNKKDQQARHQRDLALKKISGLYKVPSDTHDQTQQTKLFR